MVSVGKGERAMRLWNLVSGKKAGVLQFDRDVLQSVGEGKRGGGGEGRQVVWAADGEEFAVAFERGVVVYGLDCTPRTTIRPTPPTKLHRLHYLPPSTAGSARTLLALSTEDGRILFYATEPSPSPQTTPLAQLGGGGGSRIKDFEVLHDAAAPQASWTLVVAGSSDGAVRVWRIGGRELSERWLAEVGGGRGVRGAGGDGGLDAGDEDGGVVAGRVDAEGEDAEGVDAEGVDVGGVDAGDIKARDTDAEKAEAPQIGTLLSTHETGERITCLTAFVMDEEVDGIVPHAGGDVEAGAVVAAAVETATATDDDASSS
ncbi:Protein mak11 [Elasticomyces elasticus]|nr:Protein mak11 [Elasticomyces elasticus]